MWRLTIERDLKKRSEGGRRGLENMLFLKETFKKGEMICSTGWG